MQQYAHTQKDKSVYKSIPWKAKSRRRSKGYDANTLTWSGAIEDTECLLEDCMTRVGLEEEERNASEESSDNVYTKGDEEGALRVSSTASVVVSNGDVKTR